MFRQDKCGQLWIFMAAAFRPPDGRLLCRKIREPSATISVACKQTEQTSAPSEKNKRVTGNQKEEERYSHTSPKTQATEPPHKQHNHSTSIQLWPKCRKARGTGIRIAFTGTGFSRKSDRNIHLLLALLSKQLCNPFVLGIFSPISVVKWSEPKAYACTFRRGTSVQQYPTSPVPVVVSNWFQIHSINTIHHCDWRNGVLVLVPALVASTSPWSGKCWWCFVIFIQSVRYRALTNLELQRKQGFPSPTRAFTGTKRSARNI